MIVKVSLNFDSKQLLAEAGLSKGGKFQQFFNEDLLKMSDPFVPFEMGTLKNAGVQSSDKQGLEYNIAYARVLWYGVIMVDPITGIAGFKDKNDIFHSRKGIKKIPATESTNRPTHLPNYFNFIGSPTRGSQWTIRAWNVGKKEALKRYENGINKGVFR